MSGIFSFNTQMRHLNLLSFANFARFDKLTAFLGQHEFFFFIYDHETTRNEVLL